MSRRQPNARQLAIARRRRKLEPLPEYNGVFLPYNDGVNCRGEDFISFDDLHQICKDSMHPANSDFMEYDCGKMDWRKDPTYHMRKTR
jgi:hypothetical protein